MNLVKTQCAPLDYRATRMVNTFILHYVISVHCCLRLFALSWEIQLKYDASYLDLMQKSH